MSRNRPYTDFPRNEQGLVDNFIGTAYDTVKRVYDNLPEIQRLDDVLEEIPTLAQTSVDNALAVAMPPVLAQMDEKVQAAEGWAGEAEASAEAAAQSALAATKVNMMFPFTSDVSQMIYDVTVISGQTDVNTAGMALWVEGAIEFDFTILSATTFMLNDATAYPDNAQMRVILNAHFNDLVHGFDQLLGALEQEYKDAASLNGRWCGVHVVPPTTRLDGSPLQDADEYQNRSDKLRYSWNGSTWIALNSSAQQLEERLASPTGAKHSGYTYGTAHSETRDVDDKLRETRSILDFVPQNRKSDIRAGISTWDAGDAINYAFKESPGRILMPAGSIISTGRPLDIQRASWLAGDAPFDTRAGFGCKVKLLDGSNCEIFRTPQAWSGDNKTHFMGISDVLFDCNKAGQTVEVQGGVVKFWGAYVGSWLERVFIMNSYGTALDFRQGCDVEVSHLWIGGTATETGYALDTNADMSGSLTGGLLQFDNLYVENTSISKDHDAKNEEAYRGKNIRLRRLVSGHIKDVHTEGAAVAIDLDFNHTVVIDKVTGYNIGSTNEPESSLIRHVGQMSKAVNLGTLQYANTVNRPYMVRVSASLTPNNAVAQVKDIANPFVRSYTSATDNLFAYDKAGKRAYSNMLAVERISTYPEVSLNLTWGDADESTTRRSRFKERGLGPAISSTLGGDGTEVDLLTFRASGGSGDSARFSSPLAVGTRTTAANIVAGMLYRASGIGGLGNVLASQRVTGSNTGVSVIPEGFTGYGPPTFGGTGLFAEYMDLTNKKFYVCFGITGNASDWVALN